MARHSFPDLVQAARTVLEAKQAGDPRHQQLVDALASRLGMSALDVELRIQLLANGVTF